MHFTLGCHIITPYLLCQVSMAWGSVPVWTGELQINSQGIVLETAAVTLDVCDIEREAAFWSAVLGEEPGPLHSGGGWITVGSLDATTSLVLQKVPESKAVKNRCHVCFVVQDVDEAVRQIVALGGSPVGSPRSGGGVTMADPEGNEFCVGAFRRSKDGERIQLERSD